MISQPHCVDRIVSVVGFEDKAAWSKPTPSTWILHKDEDGEERKNERMELSCSGWDAQLFGEYK